MLHLLLASLLSLAPQTQSRVWIVRTAAGGDFTSLSAAVAGASAGDILLVESSSGTLTTSVVIDKALTVQARGAAVTLHEKLTVSGLPAGQHVELRGLQIDQRLDLLDDAGTVWVEDCAIGSAAALIHPVSGEFLPQGLHAERCDDLILVGTSARGNDGLEGTIGVSDIDASSGVFLGRSTLHAYGCTFRGGDAFAVTSISYSDGGAGLHEQNVASLAMLSACQLTGGDGACYFGGVCFGQPGPGFDQLGGQAYALATSIRAGVGSPSCSGTFFICGSPAHTGGGTVQVFPEQALDLRTDSPKREGETLTYTIDGPPNVPVWLVMSLQPGGRFVAPLRGSALIGLPALQVRSAGTTDGSGALTTTQVVPPILSGPSGIRLFVQPFYVNPVVLGRGAFVLALDSSL